MTDQPNRDSILANLGKLRESTEKAAAVEADYAPAFTPKTIQPKPTTFRKGGVMEQAAEVSLSDQAKELTAFIDGLPMMDVVKNWGKPQREYKSVGPTSVLIRCPKPEHPDNNPSASLELVEGLYHCHACAEGGDRYTMAALHYGTSTSSRDFVELKEKMALDLGYTITQSGGQKMVQAPANSAPMPAPVMPSNPAPSQIIKLDDGSYLDQSTGELVETPVRPQPVQLTGGVFGNNAVAQPAPALAPIPVSFQEDEEDESTIRVKPILDWIPLGKNRSFIDTYMKCIERDEYPLEFAFASTLICLSFAAGRNVVLRSKRDVRAPLGIVTIAGTGAGKTRALNDAVKILGEVMPWRGAELAIGTGGQVIPGRGVKSVRGVGSGENLIRQFEDLVKVPNGQNADGSPHFEEHEMPVNGIISFNELSQFVGKSSITGSTLRERMFDFIEFPPDVSSSTNTAGSYRAVRPYACMYSSIQPSMIHKILSESDEHSGQLNRFLFFTGDPRKTDHTDMEPISLEPAIKAFREIKDFWDAKGEFIIEYTPEALQAQADFCDNVLVPLEQSGNGMMGRLKVTFWRLLITFCVNEMSETVTMDILEKAKKLTHYLIGTYQYVSGELYDPSGLHDTNDLERLIIERVKKLQSENIEKGAQDIESAAPLATNIRRGVDRQLKKVSTSPTQFFNRTLDALCQLGTLSKITTGKGVRYYAT